MIHRALARVPIDHVALALAIVLTLPALGVGFIADDHFHRAILQGRIAWPRHPASPFGLFTFIDGNPEHVGQAIESGLMPWWTSPQLSLSFYRPLTELSHALDAWLWPDSPVGAHAVGIALYGAAAWLAARLYRALDMSPRAAVIAALVYAVDDGHALAVGWVAARSGLLAAVCTFACVLAHHRFRQTKHVVDRAWACAWLVASLLAGEAGTAVCGFLVAYAWALERSTGVARWSTLVPYGAIAAAWATFYTAAGFGVSGSGFYVDPSASLESMTTALRWLVVLLGSAFAGLPAEIHAMLSDPLVHVYEAIAGASVLAIAVFVIVPLWSRPTTRFLAIGSLLALLPSVFTVPQDRLLVVASFGTAGIVGEGIALHASGLRRSWGNRLAAVLLVLVHGVIAPVLLPLRTRVQAESLQRALDEPARIEPRPGTRLVVFVNPWLPLVSLYYDVLDRWRETPRPPPFMLAPGLHGLTLTREDATTLVVRGAPTLLQSRFDFMMRDFGQPMHVGDDIVTRAARVHVRAVDRHGHPTEVAVQFTHDLDDGTIELVAWRDASFGPIDPPKITQTLALPPRLE